MKTSPNGIDRIKQLEGCRLNAYRCAAGVPTIGYGHTAGVKMGQSITQEQADAFLREDLVKSEREVEKYDGVYHWNQNQFDALTSFAYNIGSIDSLTACGKRSVAEIAEQMLRYNRANGKELDGLTKRRMAERELFIMPAPQSVQAASAEQTHVQLNYRPGKTYRVEADGLRIRTKRASQSTLALPSAAVIGHIARGSRIKNLATARVGDAIWMYAGLDQSNREQWICADTGKKAYVV